jgi:hypothetical protein
MTGLFQKMIIFDEEVEILKLTEWVEMLIDRVLVQRGIISQVKLNG